MPIDASLASDQYARFAYMRDNGHLDFVLKADKCDQFFVGNQWLESDLYALRAQRRPALTINKIISTIGTILGVVGGIAFVALLLKGSKRVA